MVRQFTRINANRPSSAELTAMAAVVFDKLLMTFVSLATAQRDAGHAAPALMLAYQRRRSVHCFGSLEVIAHSPQIDTFSSLQSSAHSIIPLLTQWNLHVRCTTAAASLIEHFRSSPSALVQLQDKPISESEREMLHAQWCEHEASDPAWRALAQASVDLLHIELLE